MLTSLDCGKYPGGSRVPRYMSNGNESTDAIVLRDAKQTNDCRRRTFFSVNNGMIFQIWLIFL